MIGRASGILTRHNGARSKASGESFRNKHVVKPDVRRARREGRTGRPGVQTTKTIDVTGGQHCLDRLPADPAATEPHESPEAVRKLTDFQQFSGRERIEIPREYMEAVLVFGDSREQRAKLREPPAFSPGGVHRGQVDTEHPHAIREKKFEKRVARVSRPVPGVVGQEIPTQKAKRGLWLRAPLPHGAVASQPFDDGGVSCFLQHDDIR